MVVKQHLIVEVADHHAFLQVHQDGFQPAFLLLDSRGGGGHGLEQFAVVGGETPGQFVDGLKQRSHLVRPGVLDFMIGVGAQGGEQAASQASQRRRYQLIAKKPGGGDRGDQEEPGDSRVMHQIAPGFEVRRQLAASDQFGERQPQRDRDRRQRGKGDGGEYQRKDKSQFHGFVECRCLCTTSAWRRSGQVAGQFGADPVTQPVNGLHRGRQVFLDPFR